MFPISISKNSATINKLKPLLIFARGESWRYLLMASLMIYLFIYFCLFISSRATPAAYGGSQARSLIRAVAASLRQSHSNDGSKLHLRPTPHSSRQRWILNPWSEARDETRNLRVPSQIRFHCATMGTPTIILDKDYRRNKSVNIITISNAII